MTAIFWLAAVRTSNLILSFCSYSFTYRLTNNTIATFSPRLQLLLRTCLTKNDEACCSVGILLCTFQPKQMTWWSENGVTHSKELLLDLAIPYISQRLQCFYVAFVITSLQVSVNLWSAVRSQDTMECTHLNVSNSIKPTCLQIPSVVQFGGWQHPSPGHTWTSQPFTADHQFGHCSAVQTKRNLTKQYGNYCAVNNWGFIWLGITRKLTNSIFTTKAGVQKKTGYYPFWDKYQLQAYTF
jgi:hypothetical protein